MDVTEAEYSFYWETQRYLEAEELGLHTFLLQDETISDSSTSPHGIGSFPALTNSNSTCYYDSSSPDDGSGHGMQPARKNIATERNRRRKLNDSLYNLRSVVPNVTKMDKISVVKDAIEYIQELQQQERRLVAEISELESRNVETPAIYTPEDGDGGISFQQRKKIKSSPLGVQVMELEVNEIGDDKTMAVSITCNKKKDAMVEICQVLDSLNLNIISANLTPFSGAFVITLLVEVDDDMGSFQLKKKIETAISEPYNYYMSFLTKSTF